MKLAVPVVVIMLAFPPVSGQIGDVEETCLGHRATYVGTAGDDEVTVDATNSVVVMKGGNDVVRITKAARRDAKTEVLICLDEGNDDAVGGAFGKLDGGPGNDRANVSVCGTDLIYDVEIVVANGYEDDCPK